MYYCIACRDQDLSERVEETRDGGFCRKYALTLPVLRTAYMQLLFVSCLGKATMMETGLRLRLHFCPARKKVRKGSAIDVRLGPGIYIDQVTDRGETLVFTSFK